MNILLFGFPGGWELVVIVFAIILLFGARKIPELAKGLGRGIREFKDATREVSDQIEEVGESIDDKPKAESVKK